MPTLVPVNTPFRIQNPLPAKYIDAVVKATTYVINLTDQTWLFQRDYGVYLIPGTKDGEEFTSLTIHGRVSTMDIGDQKRQQQLIEADDIAADLTRQANEGILSEEGVESFIGVFMSPTKHPGAELLAQMKAKLAAFWAAQVRLADHLWDNPAEHKQISSLHRRAAKATNQTRPWTFESVNTALCPACGKSVVVGVAICAVCGAVLDEQKARKFFPERFAALSEPETPRKPRSKPTPQP